MVAAVMEEEPITAAKLSLSLLPRHRPSSEPPGMVTPPLQAMASVPFQWEEAPGRPRFLNSGSSPFKPKSARCLDLPPRLLGGGQVADTPTPVAVSAGPYTAAPALPYGGAGRSYGRREHKDKGAFGSCSWRRSVVGSGNKENTEVCEGKLDFSDPAHDSFVSVNIKRFRRKSSLLSLSRTSSHLLERLYESFRQMIPRRRDQEK
ncbi:hypothetical protein Nepgr_021595 [Nepenthes gracilis]|uniref:Uncharacterized protein n=1 Tax=Nepenthes gracilis TaxID=150966 RepID=A0AAD3XX66_NEPGR|nr:hypothetical protein Nepgr_021595 [Nepenthes gracilis]